MNIKFSPISFLSASGSHSVTPTPPLRRLFVTNSSEKRMVVVHGDSLSNKYFLNINVNVNVNDREEEGVIPRTA